jgi:LPXTG-motif cell wall-anchored protein
LLPTKLLTTTFLLQPSPSEYFQAIDASEKEGEDDFNSLSPEERKAILDAEKALEDEAKRQSNEKYIYIGIGVVALIGIGYLLFKKKK